jgi:hypothetical protein
MKTTRHFFGLLVMITLGIMQVQAGVLFAGEDETADTTHYIVYTGKVIDAADDMPLPFATIEGQGVNLATVTNIDGEFTLKVPRGVTLNDIKISYVGYKNNIVPVRNYRNLENRIIRLEPTSVNLQEVTIRAEDAIGLIREVLTKIGDNYSKEDMMMTAFYRETIKKRRNYVSISEAVVDIFKAAYQNDFKFDQVKLVQGRKSADVEKMDTILFKVQGGPVTTLLLDVVKNPYLLLSDQYQKVYNFYITGVISLNDRLHYVVSFNQKPHVTNPFYNGKLYIDMEKLAITEAEFELNMENEMEVASMFIRKKPVGVNVIPEKAAYRTKYTIEDDNTWYFSYARAEVKFDVKWDRKLFKTQYSTMSEIAITDRQDEGVEKFPVKERYRRSQVLDELVYVFFDQDFWKSYNVIEPDQSIESAIEKLNRRFLKSTDSVPVP